MIIARINSFDILYPRDTAVRLRKSYNLTFDIIHGHTVYNIGTAVNI